MILDRTKLLKWMLGRLRRREFDSNKQYTAELLAILLQSSQKNQQRLADANGIDVLLQVLVPLCLAFLCVDGICDLPLHCFIHDEPKKKPGERQISCEGDGRRYVRSMRMLPCRSSLRTRTGIPAASTRKRPWKTW